MIGLADRLREIAEASEDAKPRLLAEFLESAASALRAGLVRVDQERVALSPGAAWLELNLPLPGGWFIRLEAGRGRS